MHYAEVHIRILLLLKKVQRIEVVKHFFEEHGDTFWLNQNWDVFVLLSVNCDYRNLHINT